MSKTLKMVLEGLDWFIRAVLSTENIHEKKSTYFERKIGT